MTDVPIIFSGPMIRSLLEGRKTMTRRLLYTKRKARNGMVPASATYLQDHPPPRGSIGAEGFPTDIAVDEYWTLSTWQRVKAGDRLWVRETVACGACAPSKPSTWSPSFWRREQGTPANRNGIWYAADGMAPCKPITDRGHWVPSIHMPRWCSRLTLQVTGTKVERLQDINLQDVRNEGCEVRMFSLFGAEGPERQKIGASVFGNLWSEIHGPESWNANPEVVAISFRVIKANIDAPEARIAA